MISPRLLKHPLLLWRCVGYMRPPHAPRTETAFSLLFCMWCTRACTLCFARLERCHEQMRKMRKIFQNVLRRTQRAFLRKSVERFTYESCPRSPARTASGFSYVINYVERNLPNTASYLTINSCDNIATHRLTILTFYN